jgi:mRNA interferase RelE/StbE
VDFSKKAAKEFAALPRKTQQQLKPKIDALADDPRPSGVKKLSGSEDVYRIRAGDYRVVYEIHDNELIVFLVKVAHRREVYRDKS